MKKIGVTLLLSCFSLLFISWGWEGHYWINHNSIESFPTSMNQYTVWADSLANHGSDADYRKSTDPNESMRHFIDIDNYIEFVSTGKIPSTFDSVVAKHGLSFVQKNGTLPWASKIMYDSLVLAFKQHDWREAIQHASDLGHYVGDGHMPLHITKNYDGQYSNQSGVHSRYESDMVSKYLNSLKIYPGDTVHVITDVQKYILDYLYLDYTYKDSVLNADSYAQTLAGDNTSTQYYQALFNKAENFTILLWHNASHSLAELIYTAWVEAGSPPFSAGINEHNGHPMNASISPNPVNVNTVLSFTLNSTSNIKFSIFDISGKLIISNEAVYHSGINKIKIESSGLNSGIYFIKIDNGVKSESIRFFKP